MKTTRNIILTMIGIATVIFGLIAFIYLSTGIEPAIQNGRITENQAFGILMIALFGYACSATAILWFFGFSKWWVSRKKLEEMIADAAKKQEVYQSAMKELTNTIEKLFWKEYIPIKALRDTRTKEWLIWDEDIAVWATTSLPQPMPETATMEGMKELEDLKLASVPDHSEMVEGVIIIKK